MFPRWPPQFHFLNSSSPEWGSLNGFSFGYHIYQSFFGYFSLLIMDQWQTSFPPTPPPPTTSSLLCTLQLPLTLSLTLYMVLLLTGLWRSKLPLLKPCLLNHKTLEPPLFYECMLLAEVSVASLWKVLHFPCLNMPSLGGAFTHNTHRGQPITSMLAKGLVINISMFLPIYV